MAISQQLLESLVPSIRGRQSPQEQLILQQIQASQQQQQQRGQAAQRQQELDKIEIAQNSLNAKAQEANALLAFDKPEMMRAALVRRAQELTKNPSPGLEPADFIDMANRLGGPNGLSIIKKELEGDLLRIQNISSQLTSKQREFGGFTAGLSEADELSARRIELGLDPRAVGSAVQTITQEGTAQRIAGTEEIISSAKETGKLKSRLKFKPQIERAISLARSEASRRGETLTDLAKTKAAMPGLLNAVEQLRQLAPIATSTLSGKAFNFVAKELGFGATVGSTARAKFIGIVANQILPLLKPTFGAAFTVQEGEALKAALSDPDAAPAEKMAQLDAFIDQKFRNIQTAQTELANDAGITQPAQPADNVDLTTISMDELIKLREQAQ